MLGDRRVWWGTAAVFLGLARHCCPAPAPHPLTAPAAADGMRHFVVGHGFGALVEVAFVGQGGHRQAPQRTRSRRIRCALKARGGQERQSGRRCRRLRRPALGHRHGAAAQGDRQGHAADPDDPACRRAAQAGGPCRQRATGARRRGHAQPALRPRCVGSRRGCDPGRAHRQQHGSSVRGGHPAGHQRGHRRQGRALDADDPGRRGLQRTGRLVLPHPGRRTVQANGVIWLQHGFLADKAFYSALATNLAQETNSIVVAPTLPSFPQLRCARLHPLRRADAAGRRDACSRRPLGIEHQRQPGRIPGALPEDFILAGHSAGGGWSSSVGGYYVDDLAPGDQNHLLGVVMYDGVNMNGTLPQAIASLDTLTFPSTRSRRPPSHGTPSAPPPMSCWRCGPTSLRRVLVNGSHVDAMLGSNPIVDFSAQLVTKRSPAGNTSAVDTLSTGWINDFYCRRRPRRPAVRAVRHGRSADHLGRCRRGGATHTARQPARTGPAGAESRDGQAAAMAVRRRLVGHRRGGTDVRRQRPGRSSDHRWVGAPGSESVAL